MSRTRASTAWFVHELAHGKRRDHGVVWIELAAGVIWWWNPVFWHVRSRLREQAELSCDAWVISALPHGRRAYAESLLARCAPAVVVCSSRSRGAHY
jgi:beta-lactamase regulating signal transducer with metallopeptidase domain